MYRQNKLDEAIACLRSRERDSETSLLEAQILYRLGKTDACVDVYQTLKDSEIETAEVNFVAGLVSAGKASQVKGALETWRIKPTSSFELAFNTACSLIENGNYADAEQLLLTARRYITVHHISFFFSENNVLRIGHLSMSPRRLFLLVTVNRAAAS